MGLAHAAMGLRLLLLMGLTRATHRLVMGVQLLHGACSEDSSIVDAAVLLKAWLRAEDQLSRDDGPSGFLAVMVAYRCSSSVRPPDRIDAALSLFRDSLKFLAANEWSSSQVTLRGASSADAATISLAFTVDLADLPMARDTVRSAVDRFSPAEAAAASAASAAGVQEMEGADVH